MNKQVFVILCFAGLVVGFTNSVEAARTARQKSSVPIEDVVTFSSEEHYRRATEFYHSGNWKKAAKEYKIVADNFPETTYGQDANFFLGVSYYSMSELDFANGAFNQYLQCQTNPRYFEESIEYKFSIADKFRIGARKRCFGSKKLPKWASGYDLAIEIYDEVIAAMPSHDITAQAFFGKGCVLWHQKEYRDSVDAFQMLICRFPKSELAPESFLLINQVYFEQC